MPTISKAQHARLLLELSIVNSQWTRIKKFLDDEAEVLSPIWDRWVAQQDEDQD